MSVEPNQKTPEVLRKIMARDMPREVAVPSYAPPDERERLQKLAEELDRSALHEIKFRCKSLNFGDISSMATGTGTTPEQIWKWATAIETMD